MVPAFNRKFVKSNMSRRFRTWHSSLVTIYSSLLLRKRVVKGDVDVEAAHRDR